MKVDITNVDKETIVQHACGEEMMVTTGVIYSANIILEGCSIKASFKFKEEGAEILSEKDASAKIMKLFVGGRQWALN